jgi:hypothetical protein
MRLEPLRQAREERAGLDQISQVPDVWVYQWKAIHTSHARLAREVHCQNILHRTMLRSSRPHLEQCLFMVPSPHSHLRVAAPSALKGAFQTSDVHRARR